MMSTRLSRCVPVAVLAAATLLLMTPRLSRADAPAADPAAGEALFREGRRLLRVGDLAGACAKFDESQRLDPAPGTLANLADCEEKLGRLASAWEHWRSVADRLPAGDRRRATALARAQALEQTVPRLMIQVAADQPEGLTVQRDGVVLGAASLGVALPLDPGRHQIVVTAPGRRPLTYHVAMTAGEQRKVVVAAGPSGSPTVTPPAPVVPPPLAGSLVPAVGTDTGAATVTSTASPTASPGRWRRIGAYSLLGAGAVGLSAGTYFGIEALRARADARKACTGAGDPPGCWSSARYPLVRDRYYSWRADASLAAGAVAALAGGYLLFTGREVAVAAAPASGGGEVSVAARF
jgi:hypothetical protein